MGLESNHLRFRKSQSMLPGHGPRAFRDGVALLAGTGLTSHHLTVPEASMYITRKGEAPAGKNSLWYGPAELGHVKPTARLFQLVRP